MGILALGIGFAATAQRATYRAVPRFVAVKVVLLVPKDVGQSVMELVLIACCVAAQYSSPLQNPAVILP